MPSRFEQPQSRTRDAANRIALVRHERHEPKQVQEGQESSDEERPWQALVRKLRQLITIDEPTEVERRSDAKPYLRVLPGGKLGESEEQRRSTATTRGKWH